MKAKRILALVLAALTATALIACSNGGETETTTTAATTTVKPLPTPDPDKTNEDPTGDATADAPVAETPLTGTAAAALLTGNSLHSIITDANLAGMTPYGDAEGLDKLFNGTIKGDKLGGNLAAGTPAEITWKTSVASTVKGYVVVTGNDSGDYGRLPYSWEFSGSNDDGATWTVIDKVDISGVTKANDAPFGYTVDTPAAYTSYKFTVTACSDDGVTSGTTALQLNELVLVGDAEGVTKTAETPVTDAAEIDAMIAGGTNLQSTVTDAALANMTAFGDAEGVDKLFNGTTSGDKLGGNATGGAATITWKTNVATTLKNYIVYTGNDSSQYARTPMAWILYGSNDDGATWTAIDVVANSGLVDSDNSPYGFTVDAPAAYTSYTWVITQVTTSVATADAPAVLSDLGADFALQMNELVLIGDAAAAE